MFIELPASILQLVHVTIMLWWYVQFDPTANRLQFLNPIRFDVDSIQGFDAALHMRFKEPDIRSNSISDMAQVLHRATLASRQSQGYPGVERERADE